MKSIKFFLLLTTVAVTASCMVDAGTSSRRTQYGLMDYSEAQIGRAYVLEPTLAVAIARTADVYLSLSEEDRTDFNIKTLFPGGIRHIDPKSINIPEEATIYSDGKSMDEPGAKWTVKIEEWGLLSWYPEIISFGYVSYLGSYGTVQWDLECVDEGVWTINSVEGSPINAKVEPGQITIYLESDADGVAVYRVVSSGRSVEGNLFADCTTGDAGVTLRCGSDNRQDAINGGSDAPTDGTATDGAATDGSEGTAEPMYKHRIVTPLSGTIYVKFYKDGKQVDYCNITYSPEGNSYEVSSI